MTRHGDMDTGWRGSREGWLDAARAALIEGGVDAVKIQPLAKRLKLSRTSFYWFFKDRDALLAALCEDWEAGTTAPLLAATQAYAATDTEAMLNVIACFLSGAFDAGLEYALRAWALSDDQIAETLRAADDQRLAALREMLAAHGHGPDEADARARAVYLVQIGYISMRTEETLEIRLSRIAHYVEIFTGRSATAEELARCEAQLYQAQDAQAEGGPSRPPNDGDDTA
ncbi:TetR/AcrR family transcriptional regulator [Thioclava sp. BHET1]|nr:TetR/AcrR family transcriptional regulator [Thioclava sp. BHET1]